MSGIAARRRRCLLLETAHGSTGARAACRPLTTGAHWPTASDHARLSAVERGHASIGRPRPDYSCHMIRPHIGLQLTSLKTRDLWPDQVHILRQPPTSVPCSKAGAVTPSTSPRPMCFALTNAWVLFWARSLFSAAMEAGRPVDQGRPSPIANGHPRHRVPLRDVHANDGSPELRWVPGPSHRSRSTCLFGAPSRGSSTSTMSPANGFETSSHRRSHSVLKKLAKYHDPTDPPSGDEGQRKRAAPQGPGDRASFTSDTAMETSPHRADPERR